MCTYLILAVVPRQVSHDCKTFLSGQLCITSLKLSKVASCKPCITRCASPSTPKLIESSTCLSKKAYIFESSISSIRVSSAVAVKVAYCLLRYTQAVQTTDEDGTAVAASATCSSTAAAPFRLSSNIIDTMYVDKHSPRLLPLDTRSA